MSVDPAQFGASAWEQYLEVHGLPADTPLPPSLDAHRAGKHPDGLKHCRQCGGNLFTGTVIMTAEGEPVAVLKPQKCVGCGALFQNQWPPT